MTPEPTPPQELEDKELFRLASLIGCEPEAEERHRQQLLAYLTQHELSRKQEWVESLIKKLPLSNCVRHHSDDFSKDCTCDLINRDQITKTIKEQSKALRGVK